ncbi:hypothetical protein P7C70_g9090, partial [Phenoliferia sp. Uapishka_3]
MMPPALSSFSTSPRRIIMTSMLPILPLELIFKIILLNHDPQHPLATKLSAMVCKLWGRAAQKILFGDVYFSGYGDEGKQYGSFMERKRRTQAGLTGRQEFRDMTVTRQKNCLGQPQHILVSVSRDPSRSGVTEYCGLRMDPDIAWMEGVRHLHIWRTAMESEWLSNSVLGCLKTLEITWDPCDRLNFWRSGLLPKLLSPLPTSLTKLIVHNGKHHCWSHLIHTGILPHLTDFTSNMTVFTGDNLNGLAEVIRELRTSCKRQVCVYFPSFDSFNTSSKITAFQMQLAACEVNDLLLGYFTPSTDLQSVLDIVPPSLTQLHFKTLPGCYSHIPRSIQNFVKSQNTSLESISFGTEVRVDKADQDLAMAWETLCEVCKGRGISVVFGVEHQTQ